MPDIITPSDEAIRIHFETPVIDIHCHPTLKAKLFDYKVYESEHEFAGFSGDPSTGNGLFQMEYDIQKMKLGGVNSIWSSVYVVEKGLIDNSALLSTGYLIAEGFNIDFTEAVEEDTSYSPFNKAVEVMDIMEEQLRIAQEMGMKAKYVYNYDEFEQALNDGQICFIHALEGSHMLGRNFDSLQKYLDSLKFYASRGVCSITLGHFMPNNICFPPQGISPHTRKVFSFNYDYSQYLNMGLTNVGKEVVRSMFDLGIIADLTHISPAGRADVFSMNEERGSGKRPIVFSHNGIRMDCPEDLNPSFDDIKSIQQCGGVIGVTFMNYWLAGTEGNPDFGLTNVVRTIQNIAAVCDGSYDNIAIGSDMDGFINAIDDLYSAEHMVRLTQAMLDAGISEENIKKVLGLNVKRVMYEGWGNGS